VNNENCGVAGKPKAAAANKSDGGQPKPQTWAEKLGGKKTSEEPPPNRIWEPAWQPAAVMTAAKLQLVLEAGETPTGQIAAVTAEQATQLKTLAKLHNIRCAFALAIIGEDFGDTKHWLMLHHKGKPPVARLTVVQPLVTYMPAFPSSTKKVAAPTEVLKMMPLRVTMRKEFLDEDDWKAASAQPANYMIRNLTNHCKAAFIRSYGWRTLEATDGKVEAVTGFITVAATAAPDFHAKSGTAGVFFDYLAREGIRPEVRFHQRLPQESGPTYLQRVTAISPKGVAFRRGGGAALGTREPEPYAKEVKSSQWRVEHVPKHWSAGVVTKWMLQGGWREVDILAPPMRKLPWLIKALPPAGDEAAMCYVIEVEGLDTSVVVTRQQRTHTALRSEKIANVKTTFVKKEEATRWTQDTAMPAKGATPPLSQNDAEMRSPLSQNGGDEEKPGEDAATNSVPGTNKRKATTQGAAAPKKANTDRPFDMDIIDFGGTGDCAYRAAAAAFEFQNGKDETSLRAKIGTYSTTLRAKVASHIRSSKLYEESFATDPSWTEEKEGGPVPTNYQEWLNALERPNRWGCGPALIAMSQVLQRRVVIINWVEGAWQVVTTIDPTGKAGLKAAEKASLPLVLKDGHYRTLKMGAKQCPAEWKIAYDFDANKVDWAALRAAGASSVSSFCFSSKSSFKFSSKGPSKAASTIGKTSKAGSLAKKSFCFTAGRTASTNKGMGAPTSTASRSRGTPTRGGWTAERYTWKCNLCPVVCSTATMVQLVRKRSWHRYKQHPGSTECAPIREKATTFVASPEIPPEQSEWQCPRCDCRLPHLERHARSLAIKAHIRAKHPGATPQQLQYEAAKKGIAGPCYLKRSMRRDKERIEGATKKLTKLGHKPVFLRKSMNRRETHRGKRRRVPLDIAAGCNVPICDVCCMTGTKIQVTKCPGRLAEFSYPTRLMWRSFRKRNIDWAKVGKIGGKSMEELDIHFKAFSDGCQSS